MWYCKKKGPAGWSSNNAKPKSSAPVIDAGLFRDIITIETPKITKPDGMGGGIYGWSLVEKCWGYIESVDPGKARTLFGFEEAQVRQHGVWIISIRYSRNAQPLATDMRATFSNIVCRINSIVNVNNYNYEFKLYCTKAGEIPLA